MNRSSLSGLALAALVMLAGCVDVNGKRYSLVKFGDNPDETSALDAIKGIGNNSNREQSVTAAKADSSDQVRQAVVLQDKNMYWGPSYGGTYFSADLYTKRQKLVDKRRETPVVERASLNKEIAALSDQIKVNERDKFASKIESLSKAETTNDTDRAEINSHIAWCKTQQANVEKIPAAYDGDDFNVLTLASKGGNNSVASK